VPSLAQRVQPKAILFYLAQLRRNEKNAIIKTIQWNSCDRERLKVIRKKVRAAREARTYSCPVHAERNFLPTGGVA
jgi:hypothetical protein